MILSESFSHFKILDVYPCHNFKSTHTNGNMINLPAWFSRTVSSAGSLENIWPWDLWDA